jgi:hypothetical protein
MASPGISASAAVAGRHLALGTAAMVGRSLGSSSVTEPASHPLHQLNNEHNRAGGVELSIDGLDADGDPFGVARIVVGAEVDVVGGLPAVMPAA